MKVFSQNPADDITCSLCARYICLNYVNLSHVSSIALLSGTEFVQLYRYPTGKNFPYHVKYNVKRSTNVPLNFLNTLGLFVFMWKLVCIHSWYSLQFWEIIRTSFFKLDIKFLFLGPKNPPAFVEVLNKSCTKVLYRDIDRGVSEACIMRHLVRKLLIICYSNRSQSGRA